MVMYCQICPNLKLTFYAIKMCIITNVLYEIDSAQCSVTWVERQK